MEENRYWPKTTYGQGIHPARHLAIRMPVRTRTRLRRASLIMAANCSTFVTKLRGYAAILLSVIAAYSLQVSTSKY